jgi:hypothetical protein
MLPALKKPIRVGCNGSSPPTVAEQDQLDNTFRFENRSSDPMPTPIRTFRYEVAEATKRVCNDSVYRRERRTKRKLAEAKEDLVRRR